MSRIILITLTLIYSSLLYADCSSGKCEMTDFEKCISRTERLATISGSANAKMRCFNNYFSQMSTFEQCRNSADKMDTYTGENSQRVSCYQKFRNKITFDECVLNASEMDSPYMRQTAMTNMRFTCHRQFKSSITFEKCIENAESLPTMSDYAIMSADCSDLIF